MSLRAIWFEERLILCPRHFAWELVMNGSFGHVEQSEGALWRSGANVITRNGIVLVENLMEDN